MRKGVCIYTHKWQIGKWTKVNISHVHSNKHQRECICMLKIACITQRSLVLVWRIPGRGGGGGQQARAPPLNFDRLCFWNPFFFFRLLQNKAGRTREAIKIPRASRGPLNGPRGPRPGLRASRSSVALAVRCAPSMWKSWIRPCENPYKSLERPGGGGH